MREIGKMKNYFYFSGEGLAINNCNFLKTFFLCGSSPIGIESQKETSFIITWFSYVFCLVICGPFGVIVTRMSGDVAAREGSQLATLLFRRFMDQFRCDLVELVPVIAICYGLGIGWEGKAQINVLKWENDELGAL